MQRTQNYNLCQWEAEDRILRSDFNADNQKIDAALAEKADAASVTALQNAMPKIAVGTYTGDGVSAGKTISATFPIRAVFIWRNTSDNNGGNLWPNAALCVSGTAYSQNIITISGNSFTVKTISGQYPQLNSSGHTYFYLIIG